MKDAGTTISCFCYAYVKRQDNKAMCVRKDMATLDY